MPPKVEEEVATSSSFSINNVDDTNVFGCSTNEELDNPVRYVRSTLTWRSTLRLKLPSTLPVPLPSRDSLPLFEWPPSTNATEHDIESIAKAQQNVLELWWNSIDHHEYDGDLIAAKEDDTTSHAQASAEIAQGYHRLSLMELAIIMGFVELVASWLTCENTWPFYANTPTPTTTTTATGGEKKTNNLSSSNVRVQSSSLHENIKVSRMNSIYFDSYASPTIGMTWQPTIADIMTRSPYPEVTHSFEEEVDHKDNNDVYNWEAKVEKAEKDHNIEDIKERTRRRCQQRLVRVWHKIVRGHNREAAPYVDQYNPYDYQRYRPSLAELTLIPPPHPKASYDPYHISKLISWIYDVNEPLKRKVYYERRYAMTQYLYEHDFIQQGLSPVETWEGPATRNQSRLQISLLWAQSLLNIYGDFCEVHPQRYEGLIATKSLSVPTATIREVREETSSATLRCTCNDVSDLLLSAPLSSLTEMSLDKETAKVPFGWDESPNAQTDVFIHRTCIFGDGKEAALPWAQTALTFG
jgi:hypothetical protein